MSQQHPPGGAKAAAKAAEKQARLAEALRANLKRRKASARKEHAAADAAGPANCDPGPDGAGS